MLLLSRNYESIRVLVYLCTRPGHEASTPQIARALCVPLTACRKRIWQLCEAGILEGARGYGGGVRLAAPPDHIRIGDVVAAIEAQRQAQSSSQDEVHAELIQRAVARFLGELNRLTIRDLYPECRPPLSRSRSGRSSEH